MTKVKEAKFYEEDGKYFINVTYTYEDDFVIKEINIPKLEIPLLKYDHVDIETVTDDECVHPYFNRRPIVGKALNIGEARLWMRSDEYNRNYLERIIEEKRQQMTVEDIEKKLGYKIEIVSKKNN